MCQHEECRSRVVLSRCGHGTYHLSIGATTLHLSEDEVSMIVAAVNQAAFRQPTLMGKLLLDACRTPDPLDLN